MRDIKNIISAIFFTLILAVLFYSCSNTCSSQMTQDRSVKLGFVKLKNRLLVDTSIKKIYIFIKDSTFIYNDTFASKVSLELDQNNDSSIFYFKIDSITSKTTDTLTFTYHREIQLISSDCGFNTVFSSLKLENNYTKNIIDTIITVETDVNSDVDKNYKLIIKDKHK